MYQYQVSFGNAISRAFSNYCNFSGRASRSEFWWFTLFTAIVGTAISAVFMPISENLASVVSYIASIAFLLPSLGLLWRRLHDIGKSGWWFFLGFIPIVGAIILIVWCTRPSDPTPNIYGPVPNLNL